MNPEEAVVLARYVRALCPQQRFDEYTPDAWHDLLAPFGLDEARQAAMRVARRQPFVSPAEIITAIRKQRADVARDVQGPGLAAQVPDADPDDVTAYLAAVRAQCTRAAAGSEAAPRPVNELTSAVGRPVPSGRPPPLQGPTSVACPHCGAGAMRVCRSPSGRRLTGFHPSRIESAPRVAAGMEPLGPDAERDEREEGLADSKAAQPPNKTKDEVATAASDEPPHETELMEEEGTEQ
ncbi:hypothetical protein [Streptomyces sp. NPDC059009]|uniref:zinc finger domain-containing protein n=1 Tax=Streptomyces sp. NPDC059009 TaxID=3346694 RepID=UPI0036BA8E12